MKLEQIGAQHPLFDASFSLYESSFPPNERRTRADHLLALQDTDFLPLGAVEASDRSRHMGIGLSVCRAIVRAHGGEIYARNKIDGGAEFRFWLPAEEESNT